MSLSTLECLVKRALQETEQRLTIGFQGGEPTLAGLDFFRTLMELEQKYNNRGVQILHTLQTNGLLIDEDWAAFLAEHKFLTGLSIDGEKVVHDQMRRSESGSGTHSHCIKAARVLEKAGAEFNILTVVTRQLAAHPERAYSFFKRQGFRYLQFISCLDGLEEPHGSNPYSLCAESYAKFLCRLFDLWYEDYCKGDFLSIRIFDNYIYMLAGYPPESCAMNGVCSITALVEADGSVYPCDFYAIDRYLLGNIQEEPFSALYRSDTARSFLRTSLRLPDDCMKCSYAFLCRGGCRRYCEPLPSGTRGKNRYCQAFKLFFAHALPRMAAISRRIPARRRVLSVEKGGT